MAVSNSLSKKSTAKDGMITYEAGGENINLSPSLVKKYLVSGNAEFVTESEIVYFINLCRYQKLNPFLREAYCIKYGSQPATMVVGKDVFIKRARRSEDFDGYSAGVTVLKKDGTIEDREGSLVLPTESLVGGWARVFLKNKKASYYDSVSFNEYAGRKKDGSLNSQWASKPATMIRKVALCHALREAFPDDFSGLYDASEMQLNENIVLPEAPIKKPEFVEVNPSHEIEIVKNATPEIIEPEMPLEVTNNSDNDKAEIESILFGGN